MTQQPEPTWLDRGLGTRVGTLVLALATVAGLVVCALLAAPFLGALTWALALAILFAPFHAILEAKLKYANIAALVSVLIVALVVAVPVAFVVERLIAEAATGAVVVQGKVASGAVQRLLDAHPSIAPFGKWLQQQIDLPSLMATLATWLSNAGASLARVSVTQAIEIVLTFYLLFYFLRDRRAIQRLLHDRLPLTEAETTRLFARIVDTIHATVYGTIAVAAVQGLLGGLMFWFLGLPTPLLWGLVMGLLSLVPVLGAFVVWIPAAILLALNGDWGKAIILSLWGGLVVGGIDNVLRPVFVGNRLRLHTVPAFISIIGGLILFGASGFILGPLAVTLTMLLLEFWRERNQARPPDKTDALA